MLFEEYALQSAVTAIYPADLRVTYPALGLMGEAGEIANKVKKVYRDDHGVVSGIKHGQLLGEVGDVLWYIAALARDLDIELKPEISHYLPKYLPPLIDCVKCLCVHAVSAADTASNPGRKQEIEEYLLGAIRDCSCLCYYLKTNLDDVMEANLAKLLSRKNRGTLQGDGDNR